MSDEDGSSGEIVIPVTLDDEDALAKVRRLNSELEKLKEVSAQIGQGFKVPDLKFNFDGITAQLGASVKATFADIQSSIAGMAAQLKSAFTAAMPPDLAASVNRMQQLTAEAKAQKAAQEGNTAELQKQIALMRELAAQREKLAKTTNVHTGSSFEGHADRLGQYMVLGGAVVAVEESIRKLVELDKSFGELQAITQASDSQMRGLRDTIEGVAASSNQSATEIVEATTVLAKFGFTAQQVQESLKGITDFSSAVRMKPHEAATMLTGVIGAYDLPSSSAGTVADLVTSTVAKSRLTTEALNSGLNLTAEIGSEANVSLKELIGTMALAADAGVRMNERFGLGLRQAMTALVEPTKDFRDELAQVGLNAEAVDLKTSGLIGAFQTMHEAGFNSAQAMKVMGQEGAALYAALGKNIEGAQGFIDRMGQAGAASEAAARNLDTISGSFERLGNVWSTTLERGNAPLAELTKEIANVASGMLTTVQASQPFTAAIVSAGEAFGALKLASFTADLLPAEGAVTKFLRSVMPSTPVMLGLSLAAGAVAAAVAALSDKFPSLSAQIDTLRGKISDLKAGIESSEKATRSINEAILHLAADGEELHNPVATIQQLNTEFGQLGLHVSEATTRTADLIAALERLKAGTINGIVVKINEQIGATEDKAKLDIQAGHGQAAKAAYDVQGLLSFREWQEPSALRDYVDRARSMLQGSDPTRITDFGGRAEELSSYAAELRRTAGDRGNSDIADRLRKAAEQLEQFAGKLNALANVPAEVKALQLNRDQLQAANAPGSYANQGDEALRAYHQQLPPVDKHAVGPQAELSLATERLSQFDAVVGGVIKDLQAFTKDEANKSDLQFPSATGKLGELLAERQKLQDRVNTVAVESFDANRPTLDRQMGTSRTDIGDLSAQFSKATSVDQVHGLQAQIQAQAKSILDNQLKEISQDPQFNKAIHPGINPDAAGIAEDQARAAYKAIMDAAGRNAQSAIERLSSESLAASQADAAATARALKDQIDNLFKVVKDPLSSRGDIGKALGQIRDLIPQYLAAQTKEVQLEIQQAHGAGKDKLTDVQSLRDRLQAEYADAQTMYALNVVPWSRQGRDIGGDLAQADERYAQAKYAADAPVLQARLADKGNGKNDFDLNKTLIPAQYEALIAANKALIASSQEALDKVEAYLNTQRQALAQVPEGSKEALAITDNITAAEKERSAINEKITKEQTEQLGLLQKQKQAEDNRPPASVGEALNGGWEAYQKAHPVGIGAMLQDLQSGTFSVLQSSQQAFSNFFTAIETGSNRATTGIHRWTTTVKNDLRSLATSILQSMEQVINNTLAQQFMGLLGVGAKDGLGGLGSLFSSGGEEGGEALAANSSTFTSIMSGASDAFTFWHGGKIPHFWHGGRITERLDNLWHGGEIRHHWRRAATGYGPVPTRDSVPIMAAPGEFVMRQSAVDLIGADTLSNLNAMGNSYASRSGSSVSAASQGSKREPDSVHVYVTAPDQKPTLGPKDVITTIGDDILRGGQTKQLIKSVVMGQ